MEEIKLPCVYTLRIAAAGLFVAKFWHSSNYWWWTWKVCRVMDSPKVLKEKWITSFTQLLKNSNIAMGSEICATGIKFYYSIHIFVQQVGFYVNQFLIKLQMIRFKNYLIHRTTNSKVYMFHCCYPSLL